MLKLFAKNMLFVLLLMTGSSQLVSADVRNYQYDGKMPFVQMMLDMMSAMGILDRVPAHGAYGRYGRSRYSNSPWSRLFLKGNNWNGWNGNNWGGNSLDGTPWGDPGWGVLPSESYALNDGWVNESWERSSWNPQRQMAQADNAYRGNNISLGDTMSQTRSPQTRWVQPEQPRMQASTKHSTRRSNTPSDNELKQKPCVTDFCGLKKPDLNGLWVSDTGEMLGIKNNSYLWSDGDSRYLTGRIKVQNKYLRTSIDGHPQLMHFKYKHSGDHLLTKGENGKVREFVRMSAAQYYYYNQGYDGNSYQGYN